MSEKGFAILHNGQAIPRRQIEPMPFEEFRRTIVEAVAGGQRVAALFGDVPATTGNLELYAVLADSTRGFLRVGKTTLDSDRFSSLTPDCPQVHHFEREIAEQYGVCPEGHPWLKPVRFHASYRTGSREQGTGNREAGLFPVPCSLFPVSTIGVMDFYRVEGEEIHEVAVGPVHAGIIEPGHFRFQCHGEEVFHLEISLGYQHRGLERALIGGPNKRTMQMMEVVAGDTSVGHATAYCQTVEALAGCHVPIRAEVLRGIALELERLANHTGDLGALAGDVGFLPTASYCGRIRGDFLNLTALLCGSRFGRGMVRPGSVGFDLEDRAEDGGRRAEDGKVHVSTFDLRPLFLERLDAAFRDVANAVDLLWDSASVQARFEGTGTVSPEVCLALGLVGPAARACGVQCDVRGDYPSGIFRFSQVPVSTWQTGDVFARAYVRWFEIQRSVGFIRSQLQELPGGPVNSGQWPVATDLKPDHFVVSLVEGWRGEICHVALTDNQGRFARYKIVDPSFHNWMGLALALRDQQISDFPLCNKSFNLSYCGHDL